ncbi:unnamed protein product [Ranitomeya imitator]|uniref:MENTAL domain-containing protein n=1 Tax=Ranitomeya imitator TaxID=111125 RepID=A0ABN9LEE3_9NEOB|nr:unnamed protein product [Ranitomeya imitator]
MSKFSEDFRSDLERSLPAIASINSSFSQSLSPQFYLPPEQRRAISDVRRTFCLFVTFDLLFISLLWIIELNTNNGIEKNLEKEILDYQFSTSFFDIFVSDCSLLCTGHHVLTLGDPRRSSCVWYAHDCPYKSILIPIAPIHNRLSAKPADINWFGTLCMLVPEDRLIPPAGPIDSSRRTDFDSSRRTDFDSSRRTDFDSSRRTDFDSSRRTDFDSSRRTDFDSSRRTDFDSSRRTDFDSSRRTDFDSSRRTDFDSSRRDRF